MNSSTWYKKPEMIVAFSALLISVVTAVIGIYSAYIDRAYARASVWPRLEMFKSFSPQTFSYGIINSGTGPALIKYAHVQYKSNSIKECSDIPNLPTYKQSHFGNRIVSPQSTINPLGYEGDKVSELLKINESIKIEICYCSIYDECWLIDRASNPKAINSCIINENDRFLQ